MLHKYKYSLLSYDNNGDVTNCYEFESEHNDCDENIYENDHIPFTVGSNQRIVHWIDEGGHMTNDTCDFCGNDGIVREYFKVNLDEDIMAAFNIGRYGNKFCINTCYKKIDALMHTDVGSF